MKTNWVRDIVDYLENKIKSGDESDDEYGLYLEYKRYGTRVFNDSEFRLLIKMIKREIMEMYEDEG